MELMDAVKARHSVRAYKTDAVASDVMNEISRFVDELNAESGLHIQIVTNEPDAFNGFIVHYGKFSNATNYFALVGKKSDELEELCGYYGERLVLKLQLLGLNTCWVALTYRKIKTAFSVSDDEKLVALITFGYGQTQGVLSKSKSFGDVTKVDGEAPDWFRRGVETALLAPTAINQQKFTFILADKNKVTLKPSIGPYVKIDLGIVKYHFELGAGKENFEWK